jgi:hypothetical protein
VFFYSTVQPALQKYSCFVLPQITCRFIAIPHPQGAYRDCHGRWARDAVDAAATLELRGRSKTTMMNRIPTMLSLVLLVTLPETSVAADTNLQADRKASEPYQISPGRTGTCSIYIQGRYSECEFTTEHGCQKLSEVRNRPPKIALRRWYALPQEGWGWDQPRCAGKVPKSSLY